MKEKIAFVVDYYPYLGGYANRVVEQIKFLSRHFDVYLFYLFKKKNESIDVSAYVKREYALGDAVGERKTSAEVSMDPLSLLSRPSFYVNVIRNTVLEGAPIYYAASISSGNKERLKQLVVKEEIQYIWANGVFGAILSKELKGRYKVLDLCDSRYLLYTTLERVVKSLFKLFVIKIEKFLTRRFEMNMAQKFDLISFICKRDGEALGLDKFLVLPNIRVTKKIPEKKKTCDIVMVGRWDYVPNENALTFSVKEILPRLKKKISVIVIGPIKEELRGELEGYNKDLKIMGKVDDLYGYIASCRIMLAPIRAGAGVQNKIIDATEVGMPTLTTPFAKSGIDPDNKCEGIIACETAGEFADKIDELLGNEKEIERLGKSARKFFDDENKKNRKIYESLVSRIKANG